MKIITLKKLFLFTLLVVINIFPSERLLAQTIEPDPISERIVELDINQLNTELSSAPTESASENTQPKFIDLPLPDGTIKNYEVQESSVFDSKHAAKYPDIKSYVLINPDGSRAGRLGMSSEGAIYLIHTDEGMAFLDNFIEDGNTLHKSFYGDLRPEDFGCETIDNQRLTPDNETGKARFNSLSNGSTLRTYRIAIASSGEFTVGNGNTLASVNTAINDRLTVLNALFEKELAMRFVLVANNDNIIFFDAATDGLNPAQRTSSAHTVIDPAIGSANYDLGHVFYEIPGGGIATSGVATLNSVCRASAKGRGWTGATNATSVNFFLGTFAHEIGHQFGAHHSYYGTDGNCVNRSAGNGYEPGGGNSIMSYETTCNSHNITPTVNSNYFHIHSLIQMLAHANNVGNCYTSTATGNTPPVVTAPANVTIPRGTPFTLAGTGVDANGDALTYTWEQYDTDNNALSFPAGAPNDAATSTTAPLFRSFEPTAGGNTRTFPKMSDILNNTQTQGEILPQVSRTLHFRLTARDNNANGGGIHCDEVAVTIDGGSDPFAITSPTGGTYLGNGTNTFDVTWDVGNTASAPIGCANVNILFSTDGGNTFPITLASNTPNDGSETITVPTNVTSTGRIKIECPSNVFFTITGEDIGISSNCPSPAELELTLESPNPTYSGMEGDAALNLSLSYSAIGGTISNFTGSIDGTENSLARFPFSDGNTNTSCAGNFSNGTTEYDITEFEVTQTGSYTISTAASNYDEAGILYENNFINSTGSICTNWLGNTRYINGNTLTNTRINIAKTLSVGIKYYFIATSYYFDETGNYDFSISGPGDAFTQAPEGYTYTYVVVNSSGNIVEFDDNSDLSNLSADTYTVYAVAYPSATSLNSYVGSSYTSFTTALGSTICGAASSNSVTVTISGNVCPTMGALSGTTPICSGDNTTSLSVNNLTDMGSTYGIKYVYSNSQQTVANTIYGLSNTLGIVVNGSLTSSSTIATLSNVSYPTTAGTYYVYAILNPTPSNSACRPFEEFTLTINQTAAPTASDVAYCQNATAAPLTATGSNLLWYTAATGGMGTSTAPTPSTTATGTTNHYVSQTLNGCESDRTTIIVTVNAIPSAPNVDDVEYCVGETASALSATGSSLIWYDAATNGNVISTPTPSTANATTLNYWVTQTVNNCESPRANITVTIHAVPNAPNVDDVEYCVGETASALSATGSRLIWYDAATNGNVISPPTPSTANATTLNYWVSQTVNNCESPRANITVTIHAVPNAPTVDDVEYCVGETASALTATGHNLIWYDAATNGNVISTPTPSTANATTLNYWVSQTVNNCESPRANITVTIHPTPNISLGAISDPSVCNGNDGSIEITGLNSSTAYTLNYKKDGTSQAAINVSNATSATIPNLSAAAYTEILVTTNDCSSNQLSQTLTNPSSPTVNDPSDQVVCVGESTNSITFSGTSGATFNWTNDNMDINLAASGSGPIASFVTTNSTNAPITANITVTPSLGGCSGSSQTFTITVHPIPNAPNVDDVEYCVGETASALTATGSNLIWYDAATNGNVISPPTPSTANAATLEYWVTQTVNNCESTRAKINVTVNAIPSIALGTVTPPTSCTGADGSIQITGLNASIAYSLTYKKDGILQTAIPISSATTATMPNLSAASYTEIKVEGNCVSNELSQVLSDPAAPTVNTPVDQTVDNGVLTTAVTFSGTSGATFNWVNDNTAIGLGASGVGDIPAFAATNTSNATISGMITVTPSLNGCTGSSASFTITVNPSPSNSLDTITTSSNIDQDTTYQACMLIVSDANIQVTRNVNYFSGQTIRLVPGFHAKATSNFLARIQPCDDDDSFTSTPITATTRNQERPQDNPISLVEPIALTIQPNPASDFIQLNYQLNNTNNVSIYLYDITGKEVKEIMPTQIGQIGQHQQEVAITDLEGGMYFIMLRQGGQVLTKKLVVTK